MNICLLTLIGDEYKLINYNIFILTRIPNKYLILVREIIVMNA